MTIGYGWEERPDLAPEMRKLYCQLRKRVLELHPDIDEIVFKTYLAFEDQGGHFMVVMPLKRALKVRLWPTPNLLNDPNNLAENIYGSYGEWGTEIKYSSAEHLDDVIDLIKQARQLD